MVLCKTSKSFNTKFGPQWTYLKSSYQLNQFLWRLCKFVPLNLDENYVKSLRVTKIM